MSYAHESDILLLNLIREGNEMAFKRLFEAHFTAVCRYAGVYVREQSDAEQLALDIFAYVWENRASIQINLTFRAYIMTAARNRSLNFLRDRGRELPFGTHNYESIHTEYAVEYNELDRLIGEAIWSLPQKCGEVFRLSRHENLTNAEIAARTGLSVKTVEGHITKALALIRKYLGDTYQYLW